MISEGEKEEIRALLKVARNRALNFGICMGEEPIETVFKLHRRNIPAALAREAKKEGTTPKLAKGRLEVDGRTIKLCCEGSKPTGLAKNLKKYLKTMKLTMNIELVDEVAQLPEDDRRGEDAEAAAQETTEASPETGSSRDPESAPQKPDMPPEQVRYEALAAPLIAQIEALKGSEDPKARKIAAIWDLAVKRAEDGDYATGIKALTSLKAHL